MSTQIRIYGQITLTNASKPLPNVRIEFWDRAVDGYGWLVSTLTNENGGYIVVINDPIATLISATTVLLKYKVYKDNTLLLEANLSDFSTAVDISVSDYLLDLNFKDNTQEKLAEDIPTYIKVTGKVIDALGAALPNVNINIYESIFRSEEPNLVATGKTNVDGIYALTIHAKNVNFSTVRGRKIIQVEALNESDESLAKSDNIVVAGEFITASLQTITTSVQTEFDRLVNTIQELIGTTTIDDIDEGGDEVSYIAKVLNYSEVSVKNIVRAHKLAIDTGAEAEILYVLMKEKGNSNQVVVHTKEINDRAIIEKAIEDNVISSFDETELDTFYDSVRIHQVSKTKEIPVRDETYTFNDVFLNILPSQTHVDDFLALYVQDHDSIVDFWDSYTAANGGDPTLTNKVQMGLKLATITYFQPKVIEKLFTEIGTNDISIIARWDLDTWKGHITDICTAESTLCVPAHIRGEETDPENEEIIEIYAEKLMNVSQSAFPMSMIAGQLDGVDGGTLIENTGIRDNVVDFINANPGFDLRLKTIHDINEDDFDIPEGADIADIKKGLAPVQRMLRVVGSNPVAVCAMIADGVTSARAIRDMGYEKFISTYSDYFPAKAPYQEGASPYFKAHFPSLGSSFAGVATGAIYAYSSAVTAATIAESTTTAAVTSIIAGASAIVVPGSSSASPSIPSSPAPAASSSGGTLPASSTLASDSLYTGGASTTTDPTPSGGGPSSLGITIPGGGGSSTDGGPGTIDIGALGGGTTPPPFMPPLFPGGYTTAPSDDPVLSELFGSLDFCTCCDCKSLISPAAYLTDTLHFLQTQATHVYDALVDKRPDIINIDLSCKNADTTVPYIDLVNELLELRIVKNDADTLLPPTSSTTPIHDFKKFSFQTNGSSEQLDAYPEHTYKDVDGVYQDYTAYSSGTPFDSIYNSSRLGGAVYPHSLPYSLPVEEVRTYLSVFGTNRYQMMKLFRPYNQPVVNNTTAPPTSTITDYSIYAEWFGVTQVAATIITGLHADCNSNPWKFYGCAAVTLTSTNGFKDPNSYNRVPATGSDNWMNVLQSRIDVLIQQTGITYNELLQYLSTDYLNPINPIAPNVRDVAIMSSDSAHLDTCVLDKLKLVFRTTSAVTSPEIFFKKLHRFVRLVKTGRLSIYQWDVLLRSMYITDIDTENFQQIGRVLVFAEELGIAPEILSCWWNNIDTTEYLDFTNGSNNKLPSLYSRTFENKGGQNNAVNNLLRNPHSLPSTYYPTVGGSTVSLVSQIANAFSTTEQELIHYSGFNIDFSSAPVSLIAMSRWHILTTLARRLRISQEELNLLVSYTLVDGLTVVSPDNLSESAPQTVKDYIDNFEKLVQLIQRTAVSRFKVKELDFLCSGSSVYINQLKVNPNKVQLFYEQLRAELLKSTTASETTTDEQKNIVHQHFSKEFNIPLQWVADLLHGTDIISKLLDQYFVNSTYNLSEGNVNYIDTLSLAAGAPILDAPEPSNDNNVVPGFRLRKLYQWYQYFYKITLITSRLKLRTVDFQYLYFYGEATGFYFYKLKSGVNTEESSDNTIYSNTALPPMDTLNGLLRVCHAIDIVDKLKMEEGDLGLLLDSARGVLYQENTKIVYSPLLPGVFPNAPSLIVDPELTNALRNTWQTLVKYNPSMLGNWYKELVGVYITTSTGYTYHSNTDPALGIRSILNVRFTSSALTNNFSPQKYENLSMLLDTVKIIQTCQRIGLTLVTMQKVLTADVTAAGSRGLILAAKGNNDDATWAKIAKPLRDQIRVKQRDALVAYTCTDPNVIYSNLLIDIKMDACMVTTRVKQAISSVQLLVDRVVMGIEYVDEGTGSPVQVTIPAAAASQWSKWRKWYSIWQANRKIFLYPENWLEPSLRDDKSVFFKELEAQLRQDEVTFESAENAIKAYLGKVDDIAKLEPVGTCDERTPTDLLLTHAFARAYGGSHKYYHRTLCNGIWSPWQPIDIEIIGNHVVPTVWNGRLFLFWLTFREKTVKSPAGEFLTSDNLWFYNKQAEMPQDANGESHLQTLLHVSLNWTELKDGRWQNQKTGKEDVVIKVNPVINDHVDTALENTSFDFTSPRNVFGLLSNKFEMNIISILKSRIYMVPTTGPSEGLMLKLLFPQEFSVFPEYATFLHGFAFRRGSLEPTPMNFPTSEGWQTGITAPKHTLFKNNKFISDPSRLSLCFDNYDEIAPLVYNYLTENKVNMTIHSRVSSPRILGNNPFDGFRITAKTETLNWFGDNPLRDKFFYEDSRNIFFVQKIQMSLFSAIIISDPGTAATLSGASLDTSTMYSDPTSLATGGVSFLGGAVGTYSPYIPGPSIGASLAALESPPPGPHSFTRERYYFQTFYHPHISKFIEAINTYGVDGLMRPDRLTLPVLQDQDDSMDFSENYDPQPITTDPYPTNIVDFYYKSTYSCYNWEIFYHIPMLIAQRLSENQRFEEAQQWYHYIFDPTSTCPMLSGGIERQRFWKFWPFYHLAGTTVESLQDLLDAVHSGSTEATAQINQYNTKPFQPYGIARIRPLAFMKNALMKYLDNLIAWGDSLFQRDTIESTNEATQLYIMVANLLGKKPNEIPVRAATSTYSFRQLAGVDALGEAAVAIETFIGPNVGVVPGGSSASTATFGSMAYFCVTPNDKLLEYWDIVGDRLFKIRHCQNLQGKVRQLPLFDPPINPALLVQAAASGVDVNSVLSELSGSGKPYYRFTFILQKANEFCGDVKALGGALLSALEKKDAEKLALIRQGHEQKVLDAVLLQKKMQVDEAIANLEALKKSRSNIIERQMYYNSRVFMNESEKQHLTSLQKGIDLQNKVLLLQEVGAYLSLLPQFQITPVAVGTVFGGQQLATMINMGTMKVSSNAAINNIVGSMASTKGSYERRRDDWQFQANSAQSETEQMDKQIIAAEIRLDVAKKDYENQTLQIENSKEVYAYMIGKYTNVELYDWMIGQISTTYFLAYQLAMGMAKKAELCFKSELPLSKQAVTGFIKPKYWDSLKKGLLAGESLQYDLRNMEATYINQNSRTLELTKHVSLAMLNPEELLKLKFTGSCDVSIPEEYYDLDYPTHYNRRIKSVSISIPCVAGPYTTIPCTLSLTGSLVRVAKELSLDSFNSIGANDIPCSTIVTSSGQNDNGMFEFNFRDERYLPFEGAGAVCTLHLDLGGLTNVGHNVKPFDFNTINDVIIHVKYTALEGTETGWDRSEDIKTKIEHAVIGTYPYEHTYDTGAKIDLPRAFSLKHEFSNEWFAYSSTYSGETAETDSISINLLSDHFPFYKQGRVITVTGFYVKVNKKIPTSGAVYTLEYAIGSGSYTPVSTNGTTNDAHIGSLSVEIPNDNDGALIKFRLKDSTGLVVQNFDDWFDDVYIVATYKVSSI